MSADPSAPNVRQSAAAVVGAWDALLPEHDPCETLWEPMAALKTALAAPADIAGLIDAVEEAGAQFAGYLAAYKVGGNSFRPQMQTRATILANALRALRLACGVAT